MFKKAVELNEKVGNSHWNYGVIAIVVGEKALGEEEIAKSGKAFEGLSASDFNQLINAYSRTKDYPKIIELYERRIALAPDANLYASLAAIYKEAGDKQKAKEAAEKAGQLDPANKSQVDQFIQALGV